MRILISSAHILYWKYSWHAAPLFQLQFYLLFTANALLIEMKSYELGLSTNQSLLKSNVENFILTHDYA